MKESLDSIAFRCKEYRDAFKALRGIPEMGKELTEGLPVCKLASSNLRGKDFTIRPHDRDPIVDTSSPGQPTFNKPGKSVHYAFAKDPDKVFRALFDKRPGSVDRLFIVDYVDLLKCDYRAFWTPMPHLPLHVSLVWEPHVEDPERPIPDTTIRQIVSTFRKGMIKA